MGANEDTLKQIASSPKFDIPELVPLRVALDSLQTRLKTVADNPGWEGTSAEAASEAMLKMRKTYFQIEQQVTRLEKAIEHANEIRTQAIGAIDDLPNAQAPSWVHNMLDAADPFDFPGIGPVSQAQGGLSVIEQFLGTQREAKAAAALETYQTKLETPSGIAAEVRQELRATQSAVWNDVPVETPAPSAPPVGTPSGGGNGNGSHAGTGNSNYTSNETGSVWQIERPPRRPPVIIEPPIPPTVTPPPPGPNIDNLGTGQLPGSNNGTGGTGGSGGSGGSGSGLTGGPTGGAGSGGLGAGLGGGVGAAGALAAARLTSSGGMPAFGIGGAGSPGGGFISATGSAGAAPRPGSGGLLGGSGGAASGAASGGAGAGGAGSRGGSSVMSSGGMGGQGGETTKRRAGVGLGGPMAPKLDDDEQVAPRAAGTQAGGRGEPAQNATSGADLDLDETGE